MTILGIIIAFIAGGLAVYISKGNMWAIIPVLLGEIAIGIMFMNQ